MEKGEYTTLLQKEDYVKEKIPKFLGHKLRLAQLLLGNIQAVF